LERKPSAAPEALGRHRQAGGIGTADLAAAETGLREVLGHFKGVNGPWHASDTEANADTLAAMSDTGGHAAPDPDGAAGGGSSRRAPAASPSALPARILVVDDDASIRLLCRVNLELDGHEVLEADSLANARAALAGDEVAVVLLDVHLYGERSDPLIVECHAKRPPVPVVLVTGSADIAQERHRGADAVLPKPFELDELLSTVRDLAAPAAR
jgi:CheY-like chemotaxis protein